MNFSQPFISLYFNEEDSDLWGALQLIDPEKRSAFIKEALRSTLVAGLNPESFFSKESVKKNKDQIRKTDPVELAVRDNSLAQDERMLIEQRNDLNEFELADLFNTKEKTLNPSVMPSNSSQAPWEHLLYNIIGFEEDETIKNVFSRAALSRSFAEEDSSLAENLTREEPASMVNNVGLEDLKNKLAAIEGTETDE